MSELTYQYAHELFNYSDGVLYWKIARSNVIKIGDAAGYTSKIGYVEIRIDGVSYHRHRIVFLMFKGFLPKEVDHINNIPGFDKIENLRAADRYTNTRNMKLSKRNTSGVKGVSWSKSANKWHAYVAVNGERTNVGYFLNKNDAAIAVRKTREKLHREFTNHG